MGDDGPFRITNVSVFDSLAGRVDGPFDVTIGQGTITSVDPSGPDQSGGERIDGTGKTLIPGLIDAHWHTVFTTIPAVVASVGEIGYVFAQAVVSARETLMRGFTTVRDLGGPSFGIKQAIDQGSIPGPRIYPSGAGGGVASDYDPLDVSQYTEREIRAAVDAAENWGTYVTLHAYTPRAVRTAMAAGVRCIEHGQLLDEETVALMAENRVWWSAASVRSTARNAELLALAGPRNPYPGRLGVVAEGAIADLILVDGDPVADISLIARPQDSFAAIIKGGQLVKGATVSTA